MDVTAVNVTAPNVTLREMTDADLDVLYEHQADPVSNQMAAVEGRDRESYFANRAKVRADPAKLLRVIEADGVLVGDIGSWDDEGVRQVGYRIGRAYWGRGIATAALLRFLEIEPFRPLHAEVASHNVGSLRVLAKAGFRVAGPAVVSPDDGVELVPLVLD